MLIPRSTFVGFLAMLAISPSCLVAEEPAASQPVKPKPHNWTEKTLRLQLFLDKSNFGPGKIDGLPGEFTDKALAAFKETHESAEVTLPQSMPSLITHTVSEADFAHVGPLGANPEELSKLKALPYATVLDALVERYHTDPDLLRAINKDLNLDQLQAGDELQVPNVPPFEIEKVKVKGTFKKDPQLTGRHIEVDTGKKMLGIYQEDGALLALFPVSPGSVELPAPKGEYKIESITTLPVFRWDEEMLKKGTRSENFYLLESGPTNPVGVLWIQLLNKPGIGVHGTNQGQTIGRATSHGCIRLANWDAIKVAYMVTAGCTVIIR